MQKTGDIAEGPLHQAKFHRPGVLAITPDGKILIADALNYWIRKIDPEAGVVSTLFGNGLPAKDASTGHYVVTPMMPSATCTDRDGTVYYFDAKRLYRLQVQ